MPGGRDRVCGVGARRGRAPNGSVAVRGRGSTGAAGAVRMGGQAVRHRTFYGRNTVSLVIPNEVRNPHRPGRGVWMVRPVRDIAIITLLATVTACDRGI